MKILNQKVWIYIECDCGNRINLTELVEQNHCEKCGRIYYYQIHKSHEKIEVGDIIGEVGK